MTAAKARIAAIITFITTILVALVQAVSLTDQQRGWVTVGIAVLGAVATTLGVYQVPNLPLAPEPPAGV